ncbi:MAG: aminotransferase class I/II-fold pyridoxal phosphate-dependent enzyme [Solirubrobacteraceae bacterium]
MARAALPRRLSAELDPALTEIPLELLRERRSAKWTRYGEDVLPAWVAEMDFPLAPAIKRALTRAIELDDCGYAAPEALGLASAFAEFAERRLHWPVDPRQVCATSDVVGAITELLRVIAAPGDRVVITPPVYHPFFAVIERLGCEVAQAPMLGRELDVEAIERELAGGAVALILCSPHNPAGSLPSHAQLAALAQAAQAHGAWVLADEIHSPLTLAGAEHVPFLTVSDAARDRGIALCSASKTFNIPGLRCAQIVTASESAAEIVERLSAGAKHCGHLGAIGSLAAFRDCDGWLESVLAVLDHNRRLLAELLEASLPEVGYVPPQAGYLAWLDMRELGLGDDPSVAILERGRLALSPGPVFGSQGAGFARLNFATSPALVEEAVARIARTVGRA